MIRVHPRLIFFRLRSKSKWERRTAIVATAHFILKQKSVDDTFKIAEILVHDKEDLVNKGTGWMLRAAGDKDRPRLLKFLDKYAATMPRALLRYAIEKLDKSATGTLFEREKRYNRKITKGGHIMQKITPFLWFDGKAEEAANFYVSIFKDSKIGDITHYNADSAAASGQPEGSVMTVEFQLEGQDFIALNGGPHFKFTEAVSFSIDCKSQEEVDHYWNKLTADGGQESQCSWLKDKYGLSWQVVPTILMEMHKDPDPAKAKRVMEAMLKMKKIDIATIQRAYDGE